MAETAMTLYQAEQSHLVTVQLTGDDWNWYGECINIHVKSNTTETLNLTLEPGRILICVNGTVQNMVVTIVIVFTIHPNDYWNRTINATCINMDKEPPATEDLYHLGPMATGDMLKIAQYLSTREQNDTTAELMWIASENLTIDQSDSLWNMYQDAIGATDTGTPGSTWLIVIAVVVIVAAAGLVAAFVVVGRAKKRRQSPSQPLQTPGACPRCGAQLSQDWLVCPNCGLNLKK